MHFHTLLNTLSCNFHVISHNFGYLSRFWANFNMLGIKKNVLELRNSLVVLAEAVGLQKGPEAPKKGQRSPKGAESPSAALCKSWTFWCNAPKYSSVKHIMIVTQILDGLILNNRLGSKIYMREPTKPMYKSALDRQIDLFNALPFEVKKLSNEKLKYKLKRSEITVKL